MPKNEVNKKEARMQRTKELFIESALDIIKTEGLKEISVRKVADKAGYSYATIYNYFKDMNHLLMCCVVRILIDCYENIQTEEVEAEKKIEIVLDKYLDYMLLNTYAFDLLFIEDLGKISYENLEPYELQEISEPSVVKYISKAISEYCQERKKSQAEIEMMTQISSNYIFGKITFYTRRMAEVPQEALKDEIQENIKYILNR